MWWMKYYVKMKDSEGVHGLNLRGAQNGGLFADGSY